MKPLVPLVFVMFLLTGCVTGSAVLTGEALAPTPAESIEIYVEPPDSFRTIGTVEARAEVAFSRRAAGERAIRELKEQAARIGATGVILQGPPEKTSLVGVTATPDCVGYHDFYEIEEDFMTVKGTAVIVDR